MYSGSSLFATLILAASGVASALDCKCSPSDPCWPSTDQWTSLNQTVSGRLIRAVPAASVCYPNEPNYNPAACTSVLGNWTTSKFHASDPVSVDDPVWSNNSCNPIYPDGTSITGNVHAEQEGCSIGNYPVYVINATDASHIQAGLQFAKKWNLRLNIKNTGHGSERSINHGSLSIWTHHLKKIQFHEHFQPSQCSKINSTAVTANQTTMAATLGAGLQDGELFAALAKHNATAVGGTNMDVGVVGWATGGGHGLATGTYGMGADNIIEAEIVTPAGDLVTANSCQHEDLFWAIRGGGGGTYGVIVSVTVKAYPMPLVTMVNLSLTAKNTTSEHEWYRLVAKSHSYLAELQVNGAHGYYTMSSSPQLNLNGALLLYNAKNGTAERLVRPFQNFLKTQETIASSTVAPMMTLPFYDVVQMMPAIETVGKTQGVRASRFIPRRAVKEDVELLADTLEAIMSRKDSVDGVSAPSISGTMTGSSTPVDNALNTAWRESVVHLIVQQSWNESLPSALAEQTIYNMTYGRGYALRQLAPDTGCYFNEANPFEPEWQTSFFGSHYPRLHAIKSTYDPEGLLWCRHCVGSEAWKEKVDGRLCRAF
ncbi:CAZyme family AA7 [Aspergillus niger]|nr:CAZyme family AA7 [Aspergillus niger]KAI2932166.1 CAZyme family AA7 [Aspergillus niger]KAI2961734.1 CAZyme family AA7 [Aspergillus niger]KAI2981864.1 CAZyme family AA7 [Aspergillus niger]KAI3009907.1 CAZyme family AA7 [Aspergillus niger]